ncbi:MAG: NFACT RNA binding domain-containing protein [Deltaproteobacteria bacterium]|nr:NFACT RNA binding domain-containing protein [Deltaproteobacteria bacterium]
MKHTPNESFRGRILDIRQPDGERLYIKLAGPGNREAWWLISIHPAFPRILRETPPVKKGVGTAPFAGFLKSHVLGYVVNPMEAPGEKDAAQNAGAGLEAEGVWPVVLNGDSGERLILVWELNPPKSNLLLLDGDRRLLAAMGHPALDGRGLKAGQPYRLPPRVRRPPALPPPGLTGLEEARWWSEKEARWDFERERQALASTARRQLKRSARREAAQRGDLMQAQRADQWRRWGDLLGIYRHLALPGLKCLQVKDVFQPEQPEVEIPLDPRLSPGENMERFFQRWRKSQNSLTHVQKRLAESQEEGRLWEATLARLEAMTTPDDLRQWKRAAPEKLLRGLQRPALPPVGAALAGRAADPGSRPRDVMRRESTDGWMVWVGRKAEENDRLTFRLANGRDWWFHAQGVAGSHVVVRSPDGRMPPPRTLAEAAWLAAWYSSRRKEGRMEVDYTQRKYVRKIKGGLPGQVTYSQHKTLWVDLADKTAARILDGVEEGD